MFLSRHAIGNAFRGWRFEANLADSREAAAEGDWRQALQRAQAALQLQPESLQGARNLLQICRASNSSRLLQAAAGVFLHPDSEIGEQIAILSLFLDAGDVPGFGVLHDRLSDARKQNPEIRLLHVQWLYAQRRGTETLAEMEALIADAPNSRHTLYLARLLLTATDENQRRRARELIKDLIRDDNRAVALVAARSVGQAQPDELEFELSRAVRECIRAHPDATAADRLFAHTLDIRENPESQAAVIDKAVAELKDDALQILAQWLLRIGEGEIVLQLLPREDAADDLDQFQTYFAALMVEGRWEDAEQWLESAPPALDLVRLNALKASVAMKLGKSKQADRFWNLARNQADLNKTSEHYSQIYRIATAAGAEQVALQNLVAWFRSGVPRTPGLTHAMPALQALSESGQQEDVMRILERLVQSGVKHPNIINSLAYLQILDGRNIESSVAILEDLVQKFPDHTDYRTSLAFGYLKSEQPRQALEELTREPTIDWATEDDAADRAIYVTVLRANGREAESQAILKAIDRGKLLPKERLLLERDRGE